MKYIADVKDRYFSGGLCTRRTGGRFGRRTLRPEIRSQEVKKLQKVSLQKSSIARFIIIAGAEIDIVYKLEVAAGCGRRGGLT